MPELIHLKQIHGGPQLVQELNNGHGEDSLSQHGKEMFDLVAKSQWRILSYFASSSLPAETIVIQENQKILRHGELKELDKKAKRLFPKPITEYSYNELSFEQKKFLVIQSGTNSAVHLGIIEQTHSDHELLTYRNSKKMMERVAGKPQEKIATVSQIREGLALENAQNIVKRLKSNKFVFVYGDTHVFKDIVDKCFPDFKLTVKDMAGHAPSQYNGYRDAIHSSRPLLRDCNQFTMWSNNLLSDQAATNGAQNDISTYLGWGLGGAITLATMTFCYFWQKQQPETSSDQDKNLEKKTSEHKMRKGKFN